MNLILKQKELIENLKKENDLLKSALKDVQEDIVFVAGSVATAWETLGLDAEKLAKSNKAMLIPLIAGKVMKKGVIDNITKQFESVLPVLKKYAHLVENQPNLIQ